MTNQNSLPVKRHANIWAVSVSRVMSRIQKANVFSFPVVLKSVELTKYGTLVCRTVHLT